MNDFVLIAYQGAANSENSLTSSYNSPEQYFPFFILFTYSWLNWISLIIACKEKL